MPFLVEDLTSRFGAVKLPEDDPDRFLAERGGEFTMVVTSGRTGVSPALMDALPNLGAIANFGVGYDTTDVSEVARRGLLLSNTPARAGRLRGRHRPGVADRHHARFQCRRPLRPPG